MTAKARQFADFVARIMEVTKPSSLFLLSRQVLRGG